MSPILSNRNRTAAILAVLLMFLSMVGGIITGGGGAPGSPFVTASYAAGGGASSATGGHSVNDLWDTVSASSVGSGLDTTTNMDTVVTKAQDIAKTVTSILTIISFVCLLFWIARLAMSAGNPQTRKIALTGILFSGVALALFGGSWVVVSFFWNILTT